MKLNRIHTFGALITLPFTISAGERSAPPPATKTDANPLSFWDGRLVFDIEQRLRFEVRNNNRDFNDAINDNNDDSSLLSRFRFGFTIKPAPWLKLYAQVQDAREWDGERGRIPGVNGADGDNEFDLRQAYVEFADYTRFPLGLAVGRQAISYGDSRLFADSKWGNFGRTFDAVKLRYQKPDWWAELLYARPVQIKTETVDDSDAADNLGGFYFSNDWLPSQTTDWYVLHRDKSDAQPDLSPTNALTPRGASTGPAARFTTIAARVKSKPGKIGGWDYTGELAYQFGDVWLSDRNSRKLDLSAFAAHGSFGYTLNAPWKPRLGLEYDYASGDHNPDDGKSQSFQNLFPSNHEKYGYLDEFGWRNLHDARVQLSAKPGKTVDLDLNCHAFWLADTSDYWTRANGLSALRTRTPDGRDVRRIGASRFAGHEIDFVVKWTPREWLKIEAGYSHFFAGDYLRDTGPSDDADFGYVMTTVKF